MKQNEQNRNVYISRGYWIGLYINAADSVNSVVNKIWYSVHIYKHYKQSTNDELNVLMDRTI